jgi:hypothetical protein
MTMRYLLVFLAFFSSSLHAEIIFNFKNPAFNGVNYSNHVMAIDSIEQSRISAIENAKKAELNRLAALESSTPLNRFITLFQSQIYAQLASQLSSQLFKDNCVDSRGIAIEDCVSSDFGEFSFADSMVQWVKQENSITLTVRDGSGANTVITVPIAQFVFR